ncbi:MAG TPA: gamma-glutamyl-gamma-aminobutyrate hydrolase family protein [Vicinamibacterales bacterium]|nr:gamma-glutamyl-gamma-aminobutyrate hydrolase family protein [Vicinamibacterales bacterium]
MPTIAVPPYRKLHDYEEAIRRAGGDPWVLDIGHDRPLDVIARSAGLVLPGGGDVDPARYGEPRHPKFEAAEEGRDPYELELVQRALEADLPVLGICRGIQVLNVARGGTLIQDIPDQVTSAGNHQLREPPFAIAHDVWVTAGTCLERLLRERLEDGDTCAVNSRHHQAVKKVGEGLVVTATAPDGVIEAIEDPDRRFCVGVQWHPENFYRTGEFSALFEAFVKACGQ